LRSRTYGLEKLALSLIVQSQERVLWMDFYRIFEGNFKKEQGPEPPKLKGELNMFSILMDIFSRVMEKFV
jgi:hypothetical protein